MELIFLSHHHISPRLSSPTEPTTKTRRKRNKRKKERELKGGRRTRTRERQTRFCLCLSRRWDTKEETYRKRWLIVRWLTYYLLLSGELLLFLWCRKKEKRTGFWRALENFLIRRKKREKRVKESQNSSSRTIIIK